MFGSCSACVRVCVCLYNNDLAVILCFVIVVSSSLLLFAAGASVCFSPPLPVLQLSSLTLAQNPLVSSRFNKASKSQI